MKHHLLAGAVAAISAFTAAQLPAQGTQDLKEQKPGLAAQAKITPDSARKIATARVKNGEITESEIELEHKRLVYSFDLKVPNKSGVEEVLVDAKTGKVVSVYHESAKKEKAEKAADKAADKAAVKTAVKAKKP